MLQNIKNKLTKTFTSIETYITYVYIYWEWCGYVKTELYFMLFIMMVTTCFGECGLSSVLKNP